MVILGFGCAGKGDEPVSHKPPDSTKGTFAFVEKDAKKGVLRGTYTLKGYTIKFEVIRGAETPPEAVKIYPGVASHQIDVRVCDAENYCFINGTGGHGLADSSWITPNQERQPASEEASQNFRATWGLHQEIDMQATGTFSGLEEEVSMLKFATDQPPDTQQGIPPEYDPLHKYTPVSL